MKQHLSCTKQHRAARWSAIGGILLLFCGLTALAAKKTVNDQKNADARLDKEARKWS